MNHIFYAGKLHSQYDPREGSQRGPKFSWIFNDEQRNWYYMETERLACFVKPESVPAEYRAYILLLNV